jgi:hypothetical protein
MDRRTLLTAMLGACVTAGAVAAAATSASAAVPRATPLKRDETSIDAQPEAAGGEATVEQAQYFVVRRRPRRRFFWRRPWRRRW